MNVRRLGTAAALVAAAALAMPPAHATPDLTSDRSKGITDRPIKHRYNLQVPQIRGVPARVKRKFNGHVDSALSLRMRHLIRWRNGLTPPTGCNPKEENSLIHSRWRGMTLGAKYVSVVMNISTWPACGGVDQSNPETFTISLKTGKSLYLDDLIRRSETQPVVARYVPGARMWNGKSCPTDLVTPRPSLYNWVLKPSGLQFWFPKYRISAGYCGSMQVTIPWDELPLRPAGQALASQAQSW